MSLRKSKMVLCTAVYVLEMFLFAEAQYHEKPEIVVANVGENITLLCNTTYTSNVSWVKDNQYLTQTVNKKYPQGMLYDGGRLKLSYEMDISSGLFKLYIYDAKAKSETYACKHGENILQKYDVRVIGCSTCFVELKSSHDSKQPRMDVNCHLQNFHEASQIRLNITMNRNKTNTGIIKGNMLTFNTMMYGTIRVEFNPFTDTMSNVTCIVPAQLTTPQSYTSVKLSPSTSPTTISATAGTTITGSKPYDSKPKYSSSPIMNTSYFNCGTASSYQTRKNINSETGSNTKNNGITIILVAALSSISIIFVIVIVSVLRLKQTRDRQHGERNEGEINDSVDDKAAKDCEQDTCYESIGGSSGIRHGELINNVLYESSDEIIQSLILRSGDDQLDTALYTIPDKTGIINRVAKSEIVSVRARGNSSINRHQHEQKEFKQVGAANDDGTNIPIYAMPDKGPKSTRNTMNTSPGSASTEDGADIPLYALSDKRPGSNGRNIIKTTPGPETQNFGVEIPLYAVLDKGPGSKENRPTMKSKPGGKSEALNNDAIEEALYAEVDKSD